MDICMYIHIFERTLETFFSTYNRILASLDVKKFPLMYPSINPWILFQIKSITTNPSFLLKSTLIFFEKYF